MSALTSQTLGVLVHGLRLRGESYAADVIEALVAENERRLGDDEWEYAAAGDQTLRSQGSRDHAQKMVASNSLPRYTRVERRREAGPWEVIPDE